MEYLNNHILQEAVNKLVKVKKLNLVLNACKVEQEPYTWGTAIYRQEPKITLEFTATTDHQSWNELTNIEMVVFKKDLVEETVDDFANIPPAGIDMEEKYILRLAWIIYNGYQFAVERLQLKECIDKGWHPRVVNVSMRYI